MENKKLTLEDLKLESFLTEIDNSKLIKVQGGNGAYGSDVTEDSCVDSCETEMETHPTEGSDCCTDELPSAETCGLECTTGEEPTGISECCPEEESMVDC